MSGQAADWLGMAIASYEWLAAITLVVVAFCFLPKLLRGGVYTIPEFLEYRYDTKARSLMAVANLLILVGVPTATVIYSGAKVITVFFAGYSLFGLDFSDQFTGCVIIAAAGAIYVYVGGLKACAWTDLIWGAALILGGGIVAYLAVQYLGGADPKELWETKVATSTASVQDIQNAGAFERFQLLNSGDAAAGANGLGGKLHMVRPLSDPSIPWSALLLGLWIPNFFYWGLNQYIMQRTLASKSLAEGQLGIVFAAFLKLIVPFVVVIPGILAYNLFSSDLRGSAVSKNNDALVELVQAKETSVNKLYPMTDGFVAVEIENAQRVVDHNLGLAYPQDSEAKVAMQQKVQDAFAKVQADAANTETNRSERLKLAGDITAINEDLIATASLNAAQNGKTIATATKLVGYDYDAAFPTLLKKLLKPGLSWFVLAALFGAVVSSLASMLNSASTIFTMDIYHKLAPKAPATRLVTVGKIGVIVCVLIALGIAPLLGDPRFGGIFNFVQEFQGFISPGALCVFLFGFFVPRCPRFFGWFGILINVVLYSLFMWLAPEMAFLNRMAWCLGIIVVLGLIFTLINVARGGQAIILPDKGVVNTTASSKAKIFGLAVVLLTIVLYILFW
jgi:SSS family solute:Na+ symporter